MKKDRFLEDRIFMPYWAERMIKSFNETTGHKVSEYQEIELKNLIYDWCLQCFKEAEDATKDA